MKNTKVSIDARIVIGVLFVIIIGMLVLWKPWVSPADRTIVISGQATSKSEPDEYQFTPQYQKKGSDRAAIQKELADQINTVVIKLKELGVNENDIALQSSTYDNFYNDGTQEVTSNSLTITVSNKELSQKVQDYLVTTSPTGQLTPYATFSDAKRKDVEKQVRVDAIADAKAKAKQTADELGLKVGKVVAVSDPQNGVIMPMYAKGFAGGVADSVNTVTTSSLPILSGKQDISYTVEVTFELK